MNFEEVSTIIKKHLFMQVEVFKTLHMLEHDIVYVDNTPALMIPVAYAHQDFLNRLNDQSHIVNLYPSIPGGELLKNIQHFYYEKD